MLGERSARAQCSAPSGSRSRRCCPRSTSSRRTRPAEVAEAIAGLVAWVGPASASRRSRAPFGTSDRVAPLGEGDLDHVEVARRERRLEDLAGLLEHVFDVVAGGDVDEGEHLHLGLAGDRRRLADGRVAGVERALGLLLGEAGVVDEQLGAPGRLDGRPARRGVAGDHDRPARARARPSPPPGSTGPSEPATVSPRWRAAKAGPSGTPRRFAASGSKRPGRSCLDQGVAAGADAVLDREGADLAALDLDRVARLHFDQLEPEADLADQPAEGRRRGRAGRAAHRS